MKVSHAALALGLSVGCGGPPPTQPARQEVVVPEGSPPAEEDGPSASDPSPAPVSRASGDLEACVRALRDGEGVSNTDGRDLYEAGLAAERSSDLTTARKKYFELIQNHPKSGLIPLAYLAFGELFRAEAESDPSKSMLAEQAYREVTKYPPPPNTAHGYTWLRMGDVHAKSDGASALNDYKKAVETAAQYPNLPCSQAIATDAKTKLTTVYAEYGDARKAYVFFKLIAGEEGATAMLRDLVRTYQEKNKGSDACSAAGATPTLADLAREVCKKP